MINLVFKTYRGPQKVLSTVVFLYFACLLPSIAFGVLNSQATNDEISKYSIIFFFASEQAKKKATYNAFMSKKITSGNGNYLLESARLEFL